MSRKKMFRFSMKDDIELLKEVSSVNPFSGDSVNKWAEIAENFMMAHEGVSLDGRRCRERTSLLLSYFKADDRDKLYRSGTDEEYGEKEQLLQEVLELSEMVKVKTEQKSKDDSQKAQLIRKRAIENMKTATSDENDDSQCSVKRRKSNTMIDFLTHKTESENKLNQEKIELEKKKLELDEKKQQLDQERFRLEKEERTAMIDLFRQLIEKKQN